MKKLFIAALLAVSIANFAQAKKDTPKGAETEKFTPTQQNELMLKKMTLQLDLNAKQQEQMKPIIADKTAKRDAMMKEREQNKDSKVKPTKDERFAMKTKMLDEQIAMKAKMKTILSAEQFTKWDAMKGKHHKRGGHKKHKKAGDKMDHKNQEQK
ncbi:hypothetical protein [Flavobacterium sp. PL002]|uniref:hypothetical protein n=1 Tax=Flavobacterium sp. PL002 TaxID=1897058 RepID=UPI0017883FF4|nr:hypothetical protein [Flavobacterium sp. PL002]MBE0391482.1 hypothetical protein [Flavobacterium sp. PL002]